MKMVIYYASFPSLPRKTEDKYDNGMCVKIPEPDLASTHLAYFRLIGAT